MFDIFNEFATDQALERNGVWREIGPGTEVLVARANNRNYSRVLSELYEKNSQKLEEKSEAADDLSDQIMIEVFAQTILLGWRGDFAYKGSILVYSVENAKMVLQHAEFRRRIGQIANDVDNYKMKVEDEQGKA